MNAYNLEAPSRVSSTKSSSDQATPLVGQVDSQLTELSSRLELLDKATTALTERLQSILYAREIARDNSAKSAPEPCVCALAERLRNLTKNLDALLERVQSLTDSVEL